MTYFPNLDYCFAFLTGKMAGLVDWVGIEKPCAAFYREWEFCFLRKSKAGEGSDVNCQCINEY